MTDPIEEDYRQIADDALIRSCTTAIWLTTSLSHTLVT